MAGFHFVLLAAEPRNLNADETFHVDIDDHNTTCCYLHLTKDPKSWRCNLSGGVALIV